MKIRIIPFVFLSFLPGLVHALGLGPITTQSYLNQPFSARIEIISATVPELDSLIVVPGDANAYKRAGLELTPDIKKLQFKIIGSDDGEHYINVSSHDPVREPVLSFVVEARWSTGQMTRAYTVLLDPPFYAAAERQKSLAKQETRPLPQKTDHPGISEEPSGISPGPPTISAKAAAPVVSSASMHDWTVAAGDTLWSIANKTRPDSSISTDQMMLAILHANPDAFINDNINNMKLGATLQLPEIEKIQAIDKQEATDKIRMQYAQWKKGQAVARESTVDNGQPGLRILTPDADTEDMHSHSGPATGGGPDINSLKKELALTAESIESSKTENADLEARLAAAEATINDLKSKLKIGLPAAVPVHEEPVNDLYGPVAAGETLWKIAHKIRPDISISTNQMMLALLRANPEAFINGNINLLRSGAVLHMPGIQDIQSISKVQAMEEVNAHYSSWKRR